MRRLLASLFLLSIFAFPSFADTLEDAKSAVKKHDYKTAFSLYNPLAKQGEAEAQYSLGEMYSKGLGTDQDMEQATAWYEKAAEQGHLLAQIQVGRIYFLITEELVQAHKWMNVITLRELEGAKKLQLIAKQMRNDIAKEMSPEEIKQAEELANAWIAKQE